MHIFSMYAKCENVRFIWSVSESESVCTKHIFVSTMLIELDGTVQCTYSGLSI